MGLLDNLLSRMGYQKATPQIPGVIRAMGEDARYNVPDGSLADNQYRLYQNLTWLSTAIDFVANLAATNAVFSVLQREGEDKTDIPNHPLEMRLEKPNPLQSQFEFWRDYFSYRKLTGNVYVYLNRRNENAEVDEFWILPSHLVTPVPDGKQYLKGYLFKSGGSSIPLETWQVLHDKSFNPSSPFVGLSAVQSLMVVGQGDLAQQLYSTKLYDKDNAKIPGALAFADNIADPDWLRMQEEARKKWGGTKQSGPMWLRNVGAGGVQWVQMALSQKDMEYMAQRLGTRNEFYAKIAPGLASLLDENATEANAMAGRATLMDSTIWPMLVQAAQKFTSTVLPAYGDNLLAEFDDVRKSDRLVDLQEQAEYEKTHTVNEVRAEYYGDDPIEGGDVPLASWTASTTTAPAYSQPDTTQPTADTMPAMTAMDAANIEAELKAWERFAVKRLGKQGGREFEIKYIDPFTAAAIKSGLVISKTADDVRRLFASVTGGDDELKRSNDLLEEVIALVKSNNGTI